MRLLALFLLACSLADARPNLIFILSDDHRYDLMGFHPEAPEWLETPAMDRLAREGAHLANAFVSTSLCSPSRASILTGQYMHHHRVVDNQRPVPEGTTFFPQYLQQKPATRPPTSESGTWATTTMNRAPDSTTGSASRGRAPTLTPS